MRAREFIFREDAVPSQDPSTTPGTQSQDTSDQAQQDPKLQQLTTSINGLQKQIQDLQKSALQQATLAQPQQQAPKPGEAGQAQSARGPSGPGAPAVVKPGTPMGQEPVQHQPAPQQTPPPAPQQQAPMPPGVTQSPQMVKAKIQKQLAQTQAQSS